MKTTFTTINGTRFEANETNTYFYAIWTENGEQIKKRIKKAEFEQAEREHDLEVSHKMDEAMDRLTGVDNGEFTEEEIETLVEEAEESANTEAAEEIAKEMLDEAMEELGYHPIDSEWNDIRYSTCDGQSKVMAWNTVEEGMEWVKQQKAKEIANLYCRHPEGTDLQVPAVIDPQYGCVDCSKCNVQNCVHRNCMRRNPTNYGGLAECPRLKVKAEEPKTEQPKKARKSKNVFHTSIAAPGLTLTAKQVSFILHLSDTNFWEDGLDSTIWVDCLCDDIQGEFANKPMTVGAMISTLCEKGLGTRATERRDGRKCTSFTLTETGKLVAKELGLR